MRHPFRIVLMLLWAMATPYWAKAAAPVVVGCHSGHDPAPALMPLGAGPLKLATVFCLGLPSSSVPVSSPVPSPNGKAFFVFDSIKGLSLGGMGDEPALQHFEGRVTALLPFSGNLPFAWSNNSRSVLGVKQDTAKPSGHALGPLRPFLFAIDGADQQLPDLINPAGPLDEIYWVGNAGMAIAAFGTRGLYYRPEHPDPRPTVALVNARTGRVIQAIEIAQVPGLEARARITAVASRIDERGRIHALITFSPDKWVL